MDARTIKETLANIGVFPDRRLGQTFLADDRVAARELDAALIGPGETVLEIGPGLGVLTQGLCLRAGKVIAVERDRRLARYVRDFIQAPNFEVVEGDVMEVDLPPFDIAVGNLPYSVSSQIIFRLAGLSAKRALFMIQKEVAERAVATPFTAEYSRMSASLQRVYDVTLLFEVGHSHFYPQPDVDSAVISLTRRKGAEPWPEFDSAIKMLFSQRRKTINSILRKSAPAYSSLSGKAPNSERRIEELSIAQMEVLVRWLTSNGVIPVERN